MLLHSHDSYKGIKHFFRGELITSDDKRKEDLEREVLGKNTEVWGKGVELSIPQWLKSLSTHAPTGEASLTTNTLSLHMPVRSQLILLK